MKIIRYTETITTKDYYKLVEHCHKNVFPELVKNHFEKTFVSDSFKTILEKVIGDEFKDRLDDKIEGFSSGFFDSLFFLLYSQYKLWLKNKNEEYCFINNYFKEIESLDDVYQGLKVSSAMAGTLGTMKEEKIIKNMTANLIKNKKRFLSLLNL